MRCNDDVQYPTMWFRIPILATLVLGGCSDTELNLHLSSCDEMAQKYVECVAPTADQYTLKLRCEKYPVDFEALESCGIEPTCTAFQACLNEYREHADPARREKRVQQYVHARDVAESEGRFMSARESCRLLAMDPDPGANELAQCEGLPSRAFDALRAKLRLLRDLPRSRFGHLSLCDEIDIWADMVSPSAKTEADLLCREAELSIQTFELVQEVKKRTKSDDLRIPPHCNAVAHALLTLDTEWAKRLHPVVLEECFVNLGGKVLQRRKPRTCPVEVRRAIAVAARHGEQVVGPLAALLKDARTDCKQ